ncbi:Uncharacterized protein FWK35_00026844, partial [Aphis craccivora]
MKYKPLEMDRFFHFLNNFQKWTYLVIAPGSSIAHMISEKHDTETIRQWLTRWKIDIGSQIQEFTSVQSLALMAAAVISFTQFSSIQRYIEECFKILNGREFELPLCFIINDVAHFMKNVSTWKPIKDLKSSMSRKFFLQLYALIMQSTSLNEAREIIKSILIVFGVSPTDGMKICENECTDERTIVEEKRLQLRKAIAGAPNHILDLENEIFNEHLNEEELCQNNTVKESEDNLLHFSDEILHNISFKTWAQSILLECGELIEDGDHENAQYIPTVIPFILKSLELLTLWSNVMCKAFKFPVKLASSSASEASFNNVKHMIFKELPCRVDDFIQNHLDSLDGAMILYEANELESRKNQFNTMENIDGLMKKSNEKSTNKTIRNNFIAFEDTPITFSDNSLPSVVFEKINDDEIVAVENWRGKGEVKSTKEKQTYFSNDSNALYVDLNSRINKKSLGVILNGSSKKMKCRIINNNKIELLNTFAFDTLVQLFACATTDSIQFGKYIFDEKKSGLFFELLRCITKNGVTNKVYDLRVNILYHIFPHDELLRSIVRVGCHCHIREMVNKVLNEVIMADEIHRCSNDQCQRPMKTVPLTCIPYSSHTEDFGDLQVQIDDLIKSKSNLCNFNNCECLWTIETVLKNHILIEVSSIPEVEAVYGDVICSLESIPTRITIINTLFILRGTAVFIGKRSAARTSLGHYVAIVLRNDGHWEEYDDFKHKPVPISKLKKCGVQILLYTKENQEP